MISAPSGSQGLNVTGATVQIGPCSYNPWPGLNAQVAPGNSLILTQTGRHQCTSNPDEQDNFDTSESFFASSAEVVATIYHSLGIDLETQLPGPQGRPFGVVDSGTRAIKELF